MPFIGTQPEVGGYSVLDALTASATASYTLQKDSANFSPSSANQLLVSLNGVIQKPGSSFTVSGSTLTFSSALTSSDSIDFILAMGEPLLVGTPSDGTVNADKLATNAVSSAKIASSAVTNAKLAGSITDAKLSTPGVVKHMQFVEIGADTGASTTSTSFTATPVTITVSAANVAKCSNLVIVHYGSTRTDRNTHAFQERRFQRTAPSAANFNNYFLGSVNGGSESLDNATVCAVDNSLGTGDHTYTVYLRKASGTASYAGNCYTQYTASMVVVWGF